MAEKWIRTREAAQLWAVTPRTIRRWVIAGRIVGCLFGPRTLRVLVDDPDAQEAKK